MARWKLVESHYLNVPDETWEYTENDRVTGRPKRVQFPVPRLLDILDPGCWTNKWGNKDNAEGEIVVCHQGKGEVTDQVFFGDPTPGMIPLDDEAKEISASFEEHWRYKPDGAPTTYSQSLVDQFQSQMADKETVANTAAMDKLTTALTALAENQLKIGELLTTRRV